MSYGIGKNMSGEIVRREQQEEQEKTRNELVKKFAIIAKAVAKCEQGDIQASASSFTDEQLQSNIQMLNKILKVIPKNVKKQNLLFDKNTIADDMIVIARKNLEEYERHPGRYEIGESGFAKIADYSLAKLVDASLIELQSYDNSIKSCLKIMEQQEIYLRLRRAVVFRIAFWKLSHEFINELLNDLLHCVDELIILKPNNTHDFTILDEFMRTNQIQDLEMLLLEACKAHNTKSRAMRILYQEQVESGIITDQKSYELLLKSFQCKSILYPKAFAVLLSEYLEYEIKPVTDKNDHYTFKVLKNLRESIHKITQEIIAKPDYMGTYIYKNVILSMEASFNESRETLKSYLRFFNLICTYPRLMICGLTYSEIVNHTKDLMKRFSKEKLLGVLTSGLDKTTINGKGFHEWFDGVNILLQKYMIRDKDTHYEWIEYFKTESGQAIDNLILKKRAICANLKNDGDLYEAVIMPDIKKMIDKDVTFTATKEIVYGVDDALMEDVDEDADDDEEDNVDAVEEDGEDITEDVEGFVDA
jgi:hypothetical protein